MDIVREIGNNHIKIVLVKKIYIDSRARILHTISLKGNKKMHVIKRYLHKVRDIGPINN